MRFYRVIGTKQGLLVLSSIVSVLLIVVYFLFPAIRNNTRDQYEQEAARIMKASIDIISAYCRDNEINIDRINDPALTGLVGGEMTGITTTLGHLEAKRTTLDPRFASLVVELLTQAGVKRGDTIAIGSSGSFPALMIASLAAAEAMQIYPRVIISLGSSSYGANNPDFTLLDIYILLLESGIFSTGPAAVSLGGEYDTGAGFDEDALQAMKSKIIESGYPFIYEPELKSNVRKRDEIYSMAGTNNISAFINTGGSYANMGSDPLSLMIPPGLVGPVKIPEEDSRGLIFSMLSRDIPVIHLLYIKGLVQRYNMEWDPVSSESDNEFSERRERADILVIITGISAIVLFALFLFRFSKLKNMKSS